MAKAKTLKLWIEPGSVYGENAVVTRALFIKAAREPYRFCHLKINISNKKDSDLRIIFRDNEEMWILGGRIMVNGKRSVPLGLYLKRGVWDWDYIAVNSERKVNWHKWAMALFGHDFGHYIGLKHSTSKSDLMHPSLPVTYWSPKEVKKYRGKYGGKDNFQPLEIRRLMKDLHLGKTRKLLAALNKWEDGKVAIKI